MPLKEEASVKSSATWILGTKNSDMPGVYICIYIYIYTCIIYIICIYIYIYTHTYICLCIHADTYIYMHICISTCVHMCIYMYVYDVHVDIMCVNRTCLLLVQPLGDRAHAHICLHTYIRKYVCIDMYAYRYVCIDIYAYRYAYIHIYICIYICRTCIPFIQRLDNTHTHTHTHTRTHKQINTRVAMCCGILQCSSVLQYTCSVLQL